VREPSISDRIVRVLRARAVFGETSLEEVASDLSVHPRTLNRRLQADGTSFRKLANEARFLIARQLLAGTRMEITDIGLALGYAEPSGFTHAFQRWSGTAPSEWRARL
jgi:AraC-like DNA-binding protein